MKEIAKILKDKRESLGKSISTISSETRIRENLLLLIEDGEYTKLPSYIHAYGFIKKYAEYLNVDFEKDIRPLIEVECTKEMFGIIQEPTITLDENNKKSSKFLPIAIVLIIILGLGTYFLKNYIEKISTENTSSLSESIDIEDSSLLGEATNLEGINPVLEDEVPLQPSTDNMTESTIEAPTVSTIQNSLSVPIIEVVPAQESIAVLQQKQPERIDIIFTGDCWVMFTPDNSTPIDFLGANGIRKRVSFYNTFKLDIGNAAGLKIIFKDQTLEGFGGEGVVLKNLSYEIKNGKLVRVRK